MIEKESYGRMVAVKGDLLTEVALEAATKGPRQVPMDSPLIQSARSLGTCFGD